MDAGNEDARAASSSEPSDLILMLRSGASASPAANDRLEDEIAAIRAKANVIAVQIEQLQREHDALQEEIQRRESLLRAPIRRLPAELLTEVFLYLWPDRHDVVSLWKTWVNLYTYLAAEEEEAAPLFPSWNVFAPPHVCAWWRKISFCAHEMRPAIAIRLSWAEGAASTVNQRAGRYLRDVIHPSLVFYTPHNGNSLSLSSWGWSDVVQPLIEYGADCEDLTFAVSWPILKRIATSLELPRLRKLFLNINKCYLAGEDRHYEYAWESNTRCRFFERSPALTHLTIRDFRSGFGMGLPFVLPWKQLTELTLFGGMPLVYQEFLQHCSALQIIHFYPGDNDGFADRRLVVCLPHLWKLASRCDLASLSLACNSTGETVGIEEISELVGLAPNLSSLSIEHAPVSQNRRNSWSTEPKPDYEAFVDGIVDLLPPIPHDGPGWWFRDDARMHCTPKAFSLRSFSWCCRERDKSGARYMLLAMASTATSLSRNKVHLMTPLRPYQVESIRQDEHFSEVLDIYGLDDCLQLYEALPLKRPESPYDLFSQRDECMPPVLH
ncbi:uncharacterized protein SCHCODRAFT_02613006 [Schizophyllum commune H4-8]|uniref:uncharacterized protein n=1 Tax=Schizophyllum commune (strain H4-8 / FGSC 9210) TaxID=578458 RepID=UPI00215DE92A|nr:uncharacterized protein SCHCODRAFT_02613006 [Schizophyllum commune H4-8]KAI5898732.1 hypothetical protein SCHCODRAFT_02613006 [Schizophyllum commune H4-8]